MIDSDVVENLEAPLRDQLVEMVSYLMECQRTQDVEVIENYTDSIWFGLLGDVIAEWSNYKEFLKEKYPAEEGQEWEFTCEHHKRIDKLLNR